MPVKRHTVGAIVAGAAALVWASASLTAPASAQAPAAAAAAAHAEHTTAAPAAAGAAAPAAGAPAAAGATDMAHAKATFESVCGGCHEASLATDLRNTRRGWEQLVDRMFGFGLSASDAQVKEVVDYLSTTYPAQ